MTLYQWLCVRLPPRLVDVLFMGGQALLIVLVVLYSDQRFARFAYLKI